MANQLVSAGSANPREEKVPNRMLEHRAVADFHDVIEIGAIAARPGFSERHVADAAGDLGQIFAGDFGVGLPTDAVIGEETIDLGGVGNLPAEKIYGRLADDADRLGIERHNRYSPIVGRSERET